MRALRNLSIRAKLSLGFGLSLVLILIIGIIALIQLWGIEALATRMTDVWLPEVEVLSNAKRAMDEHWLLALRRPNTTTFRQIAVDAAKMRAAEAEVDEFIHAYAALADQPAQKVLLARFRVGWNAYRQSLARVHARLDSGDPAAAQEEFNVVTGAEYAAASGIIDELIALSKADGKAATRQVRAVYALSFGLISAVLLFAAASLSGAIRWISTDVSGPILRISDAMKRLTSGDESVTGLEGADRKDEIGVLIGAVSGYRDSLDRAHRLADEANRGRRFLDTALTNMSQGLCMFGADQRLLLFNTRVAELFKIPADKLSPGMPMRELMKLARAVDVDPDAAAGAQMRLLSDPANGSAVTTLTDGTIITILHRPIPGGGFVVTFEDVTERLRAEERVRHLAQFDSLTELPNRVTFHNRMSELLRRLPCGQSLAVLSLDLDRFKNINDTLGHPIGDLMLKAAAGRMRGCVRDVDIVARLGGDEFAVVQAPSAEPPNVPALAERLIEVLGAPYELDGHRVVVGASVGIAIAPGNGSDPDALMKNADLALYRAKLDGGGTYRFFEAEMDARMQARRALELDLRKAVVAEEFELYYQPIVDVRSGRVTGCEALIRWHHPERGMVSPAEFIPVAEVTGLIVPIGEWALKQACSEAVGWPGNILVSVNLSPAQFKSRNLVDTVVAALTTSGLPANRLGLEITELVLLQESEGAFAILHRLRDLGIKIAMDDFGTGYSSLGYLRSFPFDKIKIDQSFIRDLPTKQDSVAIIRAVVGLSSSLGITTTAEGVETREQLEGLRREGCTEVQGFLFAEPQSAEQIRVLLAGKETMAAVA